MSEETWTTRQLKVFFLQILPKTAQVWIPRVVSAILLSIYWVAFSAPAAAQRRIDPSTLYPVPGEVKHAGIYHFATGKWTKSGHGGLPESGATKVYDNTCTWVVNPYYVGLEPCEDLYDEGRIPSTSDPFAPMGATDTNSITSFTFAYCAPGVPTGQVDIKIAFWNNLGGPCAGNQPPTPPPQSTTATAYFDFGAVAGFPLPGDSGLGNACWIITIDTSMNPFCLQSDGDGTFDNDLAADLFTWGFQHQNMAAPLNSPSGVFMSGDPLSTPPGTCTYNIPCGTDPFGAGPCGTGLDTADALWINVDGSAPGATSNTCQGVYAQSGGTGCYSYGYPSGPFASTYLRLESIGACGACSGNVSIYCTTQTNSLGCTPAIGFSGTPSASAMNGFLVTAQEIVPDVVGILFYSKVGANSTPFNGGVFCAQPPVTRLKPQLSGSVSTPPCTGEFNSDFNAYVATGADPALVTGRQVWAQFWSRDPMSAATTNLTDALTFILCP